MEPPEVKPGKGYQDPDGNGHSWLVLAEYTLQLEMGEEELARQGAVVTEAVLLGLKLPPARLELLKNAVSQAALNARGNRQAAATSPVAGEDRQQAGLPMMVRVLTPGEQHLTSPGDSSIYPQESEDRAYQAWGYFLVERMIATGPQVQPVVELFLYPEGSV